VLPWLQYLGFNKVGQRVRLASVCRIARGIESVYIPLGYRSRDRFLGLSLAINPSIGNQFRIIMPSFRREKKDHISKHCELDSSKDDCQVVIRGGPLRTEPVMSGPWFLAIVVPEILLRINYTSSSCVGDSFFISHLVGILASVAILATY
jgi:hypothetical protein